MYKCFEFLAMALLYYFISITILNTMTLFKKYTIRHETTGEIKEIIAYDIDSDSHKYNWTFWHIDDTQKFMKCIYSHRWNIINIEKLEGNGK